METTSDHKLEIFARYNSHPKAKKKADMDPYRYLKQVQVLLKKMGDKSRYSYFPFRELVINDYESGMTTEQCAAEFYAENN